MKHLDLFSGIGGFALAAKWAGIETVAFCEKDEFCRKVLQKHWPDKIVFPDVKTMHHFQHTDLLTAGFPCQPFSVAGKQKGKDDDRYLWPEVIRIIRECRPTWIILENVPGIIPHVDPIFEDLEGSDYDWRAFLISASSLQAPHKRERIWIIAHSMRERCDNRINHTPERLLQIDWQRHVQTIQKEWEKFQPESWTHFNFQDWFGFAADATCSESQHQHSSVSKKESKQGVIPGRETGGIDAVADATSERLQGERTFGKPMCSEEIKGRQTANVINDSIDSFFGWQKDKPPIPGVDDGPTERFHEDGDGMDKYLAIQSAHNQGRLVVDGHTGEIFSKTLRGKKGEMIKLNGADLNGYRVHKLYINGRKIMIRAHQIIWFIHKGYIPKGMVLDHINRDRTDNRLCNLRLATFKENVENKEPMQPLKIQPHWEIEFRELYEHGYTGREIAELYGLSKSTIHNCLKKNNGVDRNKSLGNAIVPQIAYLLMKIIQSIPV